MTNQEPKDETGSVPPLSPAGLKSPSHKSPRRSSTLSNPGSDKSTGTSAPSSSTPKLGVKPLGPRSPNDSLKKSPPSRSQSQDQPGSSRTRFTTSSSTTENVPILKFDSIDDPSSLLEDPMIQPPLRSHSLPSPSTTAQIDSTMDAPHAPWRPPEAVIEVPEEGSSGLPPGVVAEHIGSDDDMDPILSSPIRGEPDIDSQNRVGTWVDELPPGYLQHQHEPIQVADRPQVGPGVLPRRLLSIIHEHHLIQPVITDLPAPTKKPGHVPHASIGGGDKPKLDVPPTSPAPTALTPTPSSATPSLADYERICTISDVWEACPGGESDHQNWYFCTICWAWIRVIAGRGDLPNFEESEIWTKNVSAMSAQGISYTNITDPTSLQELQSLRLQQEMRLKDIIYSRSLAQTIDHHLHRVDHLYHPTTEKRIQKIDLHPSRNEFPHITFGINDEPEWDIYTSPNHDAYIYVSCSSDLWVFVDAGMVPGQIPPALAKSFDFEKQSNPNLGYTHLESINEGWNLLITLVSNALFKGQRGWVNVNNPKFSAKIGTSMCSSRLLSEIGFGCRQEEDFLRVGPISKGDKASSEDVLQMDRYMLRTWVEMNLYLLAFQARNSDRDDVKLLQHPGITEVSLEDRIRGILEIERYPKMSYASHSQSESYHDLGVTIYDTAPTIEKAYDLQLVCSLSQGPKWLGALEKISQKPIQGKEALEIKVVTERSLDRYTNSDVEEAYNLIGYTKKHAEVICVPPREAPDNYILELHKSAMTKASNFEKASISKALWMIGNSRGSAEMIELGKNGQSIISVEDAYAAFNAPRDSIDDGLIMQYEMAINEYPGKTTYYRQCLQIIADAEGADRPAIKSYLETGSLHPEVAPRNDIPVGLQNIGNTCYLNSILQYLYSIKPLREAVISFEQDLMTRSPTPVKPEVERSKRFVRQLRLLFLELYRTEQSAVRPDEELAYLAITRPEIDQIVTPAAPGITIDTIPSIPSPSSTRVNTPSPSPPPETTPIQTTSHTVGGGKVLGKRTSEDRESIESNETQGRSRLKSEGFETLDEADGETTKVDDISDFEIVPEPLQVQVPTADEDDSSDDIPFPKSDSPLVEISGLDIKSPVVEEDEESWKDLPPIVPGELVPPAPTGGEEQQYDPPSIPPPLPARTTRPPVDRTQSTLQSGLKFGLQQDSAEVLINVLSQLELAFDPPTSHDDTPKPANIIQELFSCKYRQQMCFESETGVIEAQEPVESVFVHPIIGVEEEGKDLYDCLGELYLKGADIEYEGKKGYIMDLMSEFPPMLYIQMRRSQYDMATGRERKTNTHISFEQTLSMDRFLASADADKRAQSIYLTKEMMRTRARLHQLRKNKPLSVPDSFKHVKDALGQLRDVDDMDITPDFLNALQSESELVEQEITKLQQTLPELKNFLDAVWLEDNQFEYELVSVFMHRGKSSGAGHYWTYQSYLPDKPTTFFKYNDETVTEVPASEVLQDRTGSDANPALLCYVRKDKKLIDTLHREVYEREREQAQLGAVEAEDEGKQGSGDVEEDTPMIDLS